MFAATLFSSPPTVSAGFPGAGKSRGSVGVRDHGIGYYLGLVEPGLQHGYASSRHSRMARTIGRMRRRALPKRQGQQIRITAIRQIVGPDAICNRSGTCRQDLRVDRITCRTGQVIVDQPAHCFRAEASMHKPLLIPNCLQRSRGHLRHETENMWTAKCAEPFLISAPTYGLPGSRRAPIPSRIRQAFR